LLATFRRRDGIWGTGFVVGLIVGFGRARRGIDTTTFAYDADNVVLVVGSLLWPARCCLGSACRRSSRIGSSSVPSSARATSIAWARDY